MKTFIKMASVFVALIFAVFFVGCSSSRELKKASKGLSSYNISASLDKDMNVSGTEEVEFVNNTSTILTTVCFNLYGRAFREDAKVKPYNSLNEGKCFPDGKDYGDMGVANVMVDGSPAQYQIVGEDENAVEVELDKELEPKDKVKISMEFWLRLANCTHRLGFYKDNVNLGNWFPILAKYEKGEYNITPYYSTGDPFYTDIANYNVSFTYPEEYSLFSSGSGSTKSGSGVKVDKLSALAERDFALALMKNAKVVSKVSGDTTIRYIGSSDEGSELENGLNTSVKALAFFNKKFGKYPYPKLDVIRTPFVHGGMEYPGLVMISSSITDNFDIAKVIVHEIAHQWWYAVVGNNEITEAWLDESLAEYSSILFFEAHKEYGATYEELVADAFSSYVLYADMISTLSGKINTSMLLPVYQYNGDYEYSFMIYIRGVLMLDHLRDIVGKDKLMSGLKKYYEKYKFKIATSDDFIVNMKKTTRKDVEGFFDSWLSGRALVGVI